MGIAIVLAIIVLMNVKDRLRTGSGDMPARAMAAARAADLAQQAEANRVAERARVEQGIPGKWSGSNGASGPPTILTIMKTGDTFIAEYTSVVGPEVLRGQLQPDNQLRLVNERQVGKLVRPGTYYDGDFSHESRIQLSADGSVLIVWSRGGGAYSMPMTRIAETFSDQPRSLKDPQIDQWVNPKDDLIYVSLPAGDFMMGCSPSDNECQDDEKPARQVRIASGFRIGQTEVTQAAYRRVMGQLPRPEDFGYPNAELQATFDRLTGQDPNSSIGDTLPIGLVRWSDAKKYCEAVGMRLPTEVEWEYAARAGTTVARYGALVAIAWYERNHTDGGMRIHPVGRKQANAYGLFDMLGNVREWTADNYYSGPKSGDYYGARAVRGGSWSDYPRNLRASARERDEDIPRGGDVGFRCAGELR